MLISFTIILTLPCEALFFYRNVQVYNILYIYSIKIIHGVQRKMNHCGLKLQGHSHTFKHYEHC